MNPLSLLLIGGIAAVILAPPAAAQEDLDINYLRTARNRSVVDSSKDKLRLAYDKAIPMQILAFETKAPV